MLSKDGKFWHSECDKPVSPKAEFKKGSDVSSGAYSCTSCGKDGFYFPILACPADGPGEHLLAGENYRMSPPLLKHEPCSCGHEDGGIYGDRPCLFDKAEARRQMTPEEQQARRARALSPSVLSSKGLGMPGWDSATPRHFIPQQTSHPDILLNSQERFEKANRIAKCPICKVRFSEKQYGEYMKHLIRTGEGCILGNHKKYFDANPGVKARYIEGNKPAQPDKYKSRRPESIA